MLKIKFPQASRANKIAAVFIFLISYALLLPATTAQAESPGNILPPFDVGQQWHICQGYNNPSPGTHNGTSASGLDLTDSGCNSGAAGRNARIPIAGSIYQWDSAYGNLCVNIPGGWSYTLTHIDATVTSGDVSVGQIVGTVGAPNTLHNNGVAHIHFQMWSAANCYNSSVVAFDAADNLRICGAPDMPFGGSGSNGEWSGTTFAGDTCVTMRPAVIQRPSGETDIAVVGPNNTLAFYYNASGSSWGGGVISGSQAYSTPAIVQRPSGETDIVVRGQNNSLLFYYNAQGSNSWGQLTVPSATAYSAPTVLQRASGETDIAVQGASNTLAFYYNAAGSTSFGGGLISGTQAYSEPAMIQRASGETDIAVQGLNNTMNMYYNAQGSNSWGTSGVAASEWAFSAPSIVQRSSGETDIAVQGSGSSLDFYINAQGSNAWGRVSAAGSNTTLGAPNPPAMLLRASGEADIAVKGPSNEADFYFNAQGSSSWGSIAAAVSGYSLRAPAMVQRSTTGETDLTIIGPNNRLDFYFNVQGSPYWSNIPIAGNNSAL